MTPPQRSSSPTPAAPGLDRRLLAAVPLLLVALLAPHPAEACVGHRARIQELESIPEDPTLEVGVEREDDGALVPTMPSPAKIDAAPPAAASAEHRPGCDPEPAGAAALARVEASPAGRDDGLPNGDAARMLALAAVLFLGVDLGAAAYRRRLGLAASIGFAVLLAVGSLIYLVALSPWPQWPLMVVPAAAATVIATRALVQAR